MTTRRHDDLDARRLARTLADLIRRVRALERGGSRTTTIEGALTIRDPETGDAVLVVGQQDDGTVGVTPVVSSAPPTPTAPILDPVATGVVVKWDGGWTDPSITITPSDVTGVEVHVAAEANFPASDATRFGSVARLGGSLFVPLDPGTWQIALVARTSSLGSTKGPEATASPERLPQDRVTPGADGTVLTTVGGTATWFGSPVLLVDAGGSVPQGTPAGTVIVQKGA